MTSVEVSTLAIWVVMMVVIFWHLLAEIGQSLWCAIAHKKFHLHRREGDWDHVTCTRCPHYWTEPRI